MDGYVPFDTLLLAHKLCLLFIFFFILLSITLYYYFSGFDIYISNLENNLTSSILYKPVYIIYAYTKQYKTALRTNNNDKKNDNNNNNKIIIELH